MQPHAFSKVVVYSKDFEADMSRSAVPSQAIVKWYLQDPLGLSTPVSMNFKVKSILKVLYTWTCLRTRLSEEVHEIHLKHKQ